MIAPNATNGQNENALDAYLQTKTTIHLQNWVNTWKPASAKALSVDTMGRIDDHFSYLVPPPKQPPRSGVPPNFHTRHDGNLGNQRRRWKDPAFVRPITDDFSNVLQHLTANKKTTPAKSPRRIARFLHRFLRQLLAMRTVPLRSHRRSLCASP